MDDYKLERRRIIQDIYTSPKCIRRKCSRLWLGSQDLWELVFIVMGSYWATVPFTFFGILLLAIGNSWQFTIIAWTDIGPGCAGHNGPCLAAKVWDSINH